MQNLRGARLSVSVIFKNAAITFTYEEDRQPTKPGPNNTPTQECLLESENESPRQTDESLDRCTFYDVIS